jgi:hypothetical protein
MVAQLPLRTKVQCRQRCSVQGPKTTQFAGENFEKFMQLFTLPYHPPTQLEAEKILHAWGKMRRLTFAIPAQAMKPMREVFLSCTNNPMSIIHGLLVGHGFQQFHAIRCV